MIDLLKMMKGKKYNGMTIWYENTYIGNTAFMFVTAKFYITVWSQLVWGFDRAMQGSVSR